MPTYTIYSDTADGWVDSSDATYATARSGGTLSANSTDTLFYTGQGTYAPPAVCFEAFLSFDTSSIGGVPTSATLELVQEGGIIINGGAETVNARIYDWGTSVTTADWVSGASISGTKIATVSIPDGSTAATRTFTSETAFLSNLANPLRIRLTTAEFEAGTPAPSLTRQTRIPFRSADYSGTSSDPKLTVVTTIMPSAIRGARQAVTRAATR